MRTLADRLDRVRRPEYTGENRCLPCTLVNLTVAGGSGEVALAPVATATPGNVTATATPTATSDS